MVAAQLLQACGRGPRSCLRIKAASEWGLWLVVGIRQAGRSGSENAAILGRLLGFIENGWEKRKYPIRQLCGQKCLVDVRGWRLMDRLIPHDREAQVAELMQF